MEFDLYWLLLALPLSFGLGWLASRFDMRQWQVAQKSAPKAYFKGLSYLLNEQQDKAIDAFIEAVQHDPDTVELHFALGNLFRRRGEFERAVRVHEHVMQRADLKIDERDRAQYALAQDFLRAGLFDRAEQALERLRNSRYRQEALLALLNLHERARHWRGAMEVAKELQAMGMASFAQRMAHHWCELAAEAELSGDDQRALEALEAATQVDPDAARPWVMLGRRQLRALQPALALEAWNRLAKVQPGSFALVAQSYAETAIQLRQEQQARRVLEDLQAQHPSVDQLRALNLLEDEGAKRRQRLAQVLEQQPLLSNAQALMHEAHLDGQALTQAEEQAVFHAIREAARPLQRYGCAACGFKAQQHFWQCPGCLSWESYPPRRVEEL